MLCRATQDGRVMVESSDKMWSSGEGNGKSLQHSCLENPINSMKRQKGMTLKDELPVLVGTQYVTGEEQRIKARKNEEDEPKQKQSPVLYVTDSGSKVNPRMPCRVGPDLNPSFIYTGTVVHQNLASTSTQNCLWLTLEKDRKSSKVTGIQFFTLNYFLDNEKRCLIFCTVEFVEWDFYFLVYSCPLFCQLLV